MQTRIAGIAWFDSATYPQAVAVMDDRDRFPDTHAKWLVQAQQIEQQHLNAGISVVRAIIDPEHFKAWCHDRGLNVDSKGRVAFANFIAMQSHKNA